MVDEAAAAAAVVVADSERPAAWAATEEVRSAAFFLPMGVYEYCGRKEGKSAGKRDRNDNEK